MKRSDKHKAFHVAAIGASAGGLKAFEELLSALPRRPGLAIILVPHLAPQYESHLSEILARNTALFVREVRSGDKVLPDQVYILPPDRAMQIKRGILYLSSSGSKADWRNPIDSFFRSLAEDQGPLAVGVLLSGEGTDGTEGMRAIREAGGTTFAQSGGTAAHFSMPRSAAAAGWADFVLSPAAIGKRLGSLPDDGARKASFLTAVHPEEAMNGILELLRSSKGVEFGLYKRNTLRRRIQRRMAIKRVYNAAAYLRMLKAYPGELELLYRDVLISVTSFFREPETFKELKRTIYPRLLKKRAPESPLRIWVPGCSTGEEAYSHAMNLVEFLGERAAHIPFQIFATDVNPVVIERARIGFYPAKIKSELSPERLKRFFIRTEGGYSIAPAIRERCIFAAKDLVKDPPFINLDLVSCRNLLIYLGPSLQEKALKIFQYALKPGGILMLGRSESIGNLSGSFSPLNVRRKVFSERMAGSRFLPDFGPAGRFLETESAFKPPAYGVQGSEKPVVEAPYLQDELAQVLPARYAPNGVIVNGEMEILRFLGDTSAYLRPAPGKPSMNLRRMASGDLLLELRAAIHVAKKSGRAAQKDILGVSGGKGVRVEVLPIQVSDPDKFYFLILFEKLCPEPAAGARPPEKSRAGDSRRIIKLEEDLVVSGENLKAIIEEQETTNSRLKDSNEELLSSNEELQSINEEFETAKEELQSANEELVTANEEAGRSNQVLNLANSDLSNLLASIDIPVIMLSPDLSVRRLTPAAEALFDLPRNIVGRPLQDLGLPLVLPNLRQLLLGVVRTGVAREVEAQDKRGRWYSLLLRPYRTGSGRTEGAVLALLDIHERKLSEKNMLRLATLVRDSNDAVIIRDLHDRIIAWNKGAQRMYGYTPAEAIGMNVGRLMPADARIGTSDLLRLSERGKTAAPIATTRLTKSGRRLDVLFTVTLLCDEKGVPAEIAITERDITAQKKDEREMRRLHASVITAQETERRRIARDLHDGVGQILSGVKFKLESLAGGSSACKSGAGQILEVSSSLNKAIAEIRRVSENLMPSELENLGLVPALRTLCRDFKASGVSLKLRVGRLPEKIAPELALTLFRVTQEALNNISKHSRANRVFVSLIKKGAFFLLSISDNGRGVSPGNKQYQSGKGLGLLSMRERAENLGGSFELLSARKAGTYITVRVPTVVPARSRR